MTKKISNNQFLRRIPQCLMHIESDQILLDTFNKQFIQCFSMPLEMGKTCTSMSFDQLCHHQDLPKTSEYRELNNPDKEGQILFFRLINQQNEWQWMTCLLFRLVGESRSQHQVFSIYFFKISFILNLQRLRRLCSVFPKAAEPSPLSLLSEREKEVLSLIATGKSYKQISTLLHIQPDTVNRHRKNMMKKLKIRNIQLLTCFAIEHGLT